LFVTGYGVSYTLYWITLLAVGWWMWEVTGSASWVGFVFFCDLFPAVLVTPWASALADRGDRFRILKIILWIQVCAGFALSGVALLGLLTPPILAAFVFVEGALIGFSQPAFFGLVNRLVKPENLSAAVGLNTSITQSTYILGPLLAGLLFSFGMLSLIHISEPTRLRRISYAVFCLQKKKIIPISCTLTTYTTSISLLNSFPPYRSRHPPSTLSY